MHHNPQIRRFVSTHDLPISYIDSQPFLGADIYFKRTNEGWEILLYPRVFHSRIGDLLTLAALASIKRRESSWFIYPEQRQFEQEVSHWVKMQGLGNDAAKLAVEHLRGFRDSLFFAFELRYLIDNDYLTTDELRDLTSYLSSHFVSTRVASQFLASIGVLRSIGGAVSLFHDELIERKRYGFLRSVDVFEAALKAGAVETRSAIELWAVLGPAHQEEVNDLAVVAKRIWGPRVESDIDYDLALSFADEDRAVAKQIAEAVSTAGFRPFFDEYERAGLWGKDLYAHLTEVYSKRARYCLIIVSSHYSRKQWTSLERQAAQARALSSSAEYILPLVLDDTQLPGLLPTIHYLDLRTTPLEEVISHLIAKLSFVDPA